MTTTPVLVRVPQTRADREEQMAFIHRAKNPGKRTSQTRSNDRRQAIRESREDA